MNIRVNVGGVKIVTAKDRKMFGVWQKCQDNGTEIPTEVKHFLLAEAQEINLEDSLARGDNYPECGEGLTIDLRKLPKDIKMIRIEVE
jgi:hypothetical protein